MKKAYGGAGIDYKMVYLLNLYKDQIEAAFHLETCSWGVELYII